ncbi:hypothetical protein ACFE04_024651 [Oxalis oulophora]
MGRVKLKIKRLENTNGRQATYAKRKHGIMKKANELSILCDIDIILLMFSPTGKPSLCTGKRSSIDEVVAKFAQLTPQERSKRKLESLEALRKTFKKLDHDVNIEEFLGASSQSAEELSNQAMLLQNRLNEVHRRLSVWTNPEKIDNVEHLGQMENSLRESLNHIQAHKENLEKQQFMSLECSSQLPNGIHLPMRMGADQQLQPIPWPPNKDSRQIVLPDDQNLLPHREVDCSINNSFYSSYFGTTKSSDISNSGQEINIINDLNGNTPLSLQLNGQFPFMPYSMLNDPKFQSVADLSVQENPGDYHVNGGLGPPRPSYDATQINWPSTSNPCAITMFDDHLYSREPNGCLLTLECTLYPDKEVEIFEINILLSFEMTLWLRLNDIMAIAPIVAIAFLSP